MNILLRRTAALPAIAGAAFLLSIAGAHSASAQVSFATFTQKDTSASPFTFTNSGSGSTLTASTDVTWNWLVGSSVTNANTPIDAVMTFSAVVTGTATASANNPMVRQGLSITDMVFTDKATGKILLNVLTPEAATMIGQKGSTTASVTGTHASYSSDYLSFGPATTGKLTVTLASINPTVQRASNNYLRGFSSSGTGTFSNGSQPVPEFGTILSLGTMVSGAGVFSIRRRRRSIGSVAADLKAA